MKSDQLARRARTATTRVPPKSAASALTKLRKRSTDAQKRLAALRTRGARWLEKHPGRAVIGAFAGAFALGVSVAKVARRG